MLYEVITRIRRVARRGGPVDSFDAIRVAPNGGPGMSFPLEPTDARREEIVEALAREIRIV